MKINNSDDLRTAILELEDKKRREKEQLVQHFHEFTESLTPINLIKSTFHQARETPGLAGSVVKATLGMGAGFLSRKILVGSSRGIFKKLIGSLVETGVAGLVTKNSDGIIKSSGGRLIRALLWFEEKT